VDSQKIKAFTTEDTEDTEFFWVRDAYGIRTFAVNKKGFSL